MKLKSRIYNIDARGSYIVVLNPKLIELFDLKPMDKVRIMSSNKYLVAVANSSEELKDDEIGIFVDVKEKLKIVDGELVTVLPEERLSSITAIRKKMDNKALNQKEFYDIVTDIVDRRLTKAEIAYFIASAYMRKFSMEEVEYMVRSMSETGDVITWDEKPIIDKHCIGGIGGNRTTMLVVPIVVASGLKMPKTSSRSITSPAGTADTMEVLTRVSFDDVAEIKTIVNKTGGCMVWGGSLDLAPADDDIIKIEHPLSLDPTPMLLSSIMAKKYVAGATHVLIDIPVGEFSKVKTLKEYNDLRKKFIDLGKRLNIKVEVIKTPGNQPIGNGLGPALEARDVLWTLERDKRAPQDLREKSIYMAGILLEMGGKAKKGQGKKLAKKILDSGKALKKFKEIISAQDGASKSISGDKIKLGKIVYEVRSTRHGKISVVNDDILSKAARLAGAPYDKKAGLYLNVHIGDKVKVGDILFTIYSETENHLDDAATYVQRNKPITIS